MVDLSRSFGYFEEFLVPLGKVGLSAPDPTTPDKERAYAFTPIRFGLFPFRSPLLRKSKFLSFPQGTEMVHFPWFASTKKLVDIRHYWRMGYPIRESPDQRLLAPPRGLSQLATPFIARIRQGIHHKPLLAWP